jgi:hypothetical protein
MRKLDAVVELADSVNWWPNTIPKVASVIVGRLGFRSGNDLLSDLNRQVCLFEMGSL